MTSSGTIVYLIVNKIDGKMYIGVTKRGLENRKREHLNYARRGIKGKLYYAIRKHGEDNFSFIVVREFEKYEDALIKEIELIASVRPEYNVSAGGQGATYWLGKSRDLETKKKISLSKTGIPRRPPSPSVLKIFAENMRRAAKAKRKPVKCLNDGRVFESAQSASMSYGMDRCTVSAVCSGRRKSAYGLRFSYMETAP